MKSFKRIAGIIVLLLLIAGVFMAWRFLGSNTNFDENKKAIYIPTGSNFDDLMNYIEKENILKNPGSFKWAAKQVKYDKNILAGKYIIEKGSSIYNVLRLLKSGKQTPVNFVITKLRTKENLAQKIANNFEIDSTSVIHFLNNNDVLSSYHLDSNTVMTAVIPNTYSIYWNTPLNKIFSKLYNEQEKFWTPERRKKAQALNLTPQQVYTVASIVEEETNKAEDKGKIASVYLNRVAAGEKLEADPTVKFALKDFSLPRLYNKHLEYLSPYNTYRNKGLPPGPICTPSVKTIDAVLDAPATNYMFFAARPDFSGYHNFATTYEEHLIYARAYRQALDSLQKARAGK